MILRGMGMSLRANHLFSALRCGPNALAKTFSHDRENKDGARNLKGDSACRLNAVELVKSEEGNRLNDEG